MSDVEEDKTDLEEGVEPESPPEGVGEEAKPEVDVVALQDELRRTKEQIDNLNRAIHEERGEKKALKEQLAEIVTPKEEPEEQYDPEEIITMRQARDMLQGEIGKLRSEWQAQQTNMQTLAMSEQKVMAEHEDYREVVQSLAPYLNQNPEIAQSFMKDPATAPAKLYELGKMVQGKLDKQATAEALANPVKQPATMGQRSASSQKIGSGVDWANITMDEASAILAEAKKKGDSYYKKLVGEA